MTTDFNSSNPKRQQDGSKDSSGQSVGRRPRFLSLPALRFQDEYVWLIGLAGMDVMLTWFVLEKMGGEEVNPIAKLVIDAWGLWGAIGFKFSLLLFVVLACEWISRTNRRVGKFLVWFALIVSASPVVYTASLLFYHWMQSAPIA